MYWSKLRSRKKPRKVESIAKKLRSEGKSTQEFEIFINNITLEELIQLKLEVSTRMVLFHKFYGFPLWALIPKIAREALLKFALSQTNVRKDTASLLGVTPAYLTSIINKFKPFGDDLDSIGSQKKEIQDDGAKPSISITE